MIDRLSPRTKQWILRTFLAAGFLLPLRGLLRSQGPPMDEGFMLVFPEQVLRGYLPNEDFLHLYGPGSLWWLAGIFKIFGMLLEVERLAALVQMVAVVSGVTIIAKRWSRTLALACGGVSLVIIIPPIGLTALAWVGAVGLGILGVACATASVGEDKSERGAARLAFFGGLLFGSALLFRLDLVVAVGLAGISLVRAFDKRRRLNLISGVLVGISPYLVHIATAGPYNVFRGMVLDPVVYLRGGRTLPLPPSFTTLAGFLQRAGDYGSVGKLDWPLPTFGAAAQIAIWFWALLATVGLIMYVATRRNRRTGGTLRSVSLITVAWFSIGLLPQAMQRADSAHLAWVSCVPLALLPVAIRELLESRRGLSWTPRHLDLAAVLPIVLFISLVIPRYILNTYADFTAQTFGRHRYSYLVERGDRRFYYGRIEVADAAQYGVIPALDAASHSGDSLIVATADLRKTPYSDAYLYYLYPELKVGTYYIEMDPGVANAADSKLPQEIAVADFLVLSSVWHDWDEPNDARDAIDNGSNSAVRENFVCLGEFGMLPPSAPAPMDFIYQVWMNEALVAERGLPHGALGEHGRACSQGLMLAD